MKKLIKLSLIALVISILFCLNGCGKDESDYKSAISEHMKNFHGVTINSYQSLSISENGSAFANVNVSASTDFGANIGMSAQLNLDKECSITSCSWCKLDSLK